MNRREFLNQSSMAIATYDLCRDYCRGGCGEPRIYSIKRSPGHEPTNPAPPRGADT